MKLSNVFLLIIFGFMLSCGDNEMPSDTAINEVFLEGDGGVTGMVIPNSNTIVIWNSNHLTFLDGNGLFQKTVLPQDHRCGSVAAQNDQIFVSGRNNFSNAIGISSYGMNGDLLWEKLISHENEELEAPHVKLVNDHVVLAYIAYSEDNSAVIKKALQVRIFSMDGVSVDSSEIVFEVEADFFTIHIVIEDQQSFLLQGSKKVITGPDEKGIVVYRFKDEEVDWAKEYGSPGFATVTKVIEGANGNFLMVGSKQTAAWAFSLDLNGALQWEFEHGDGINKYWFMDAMYQGNSIIFCGFTNATPEQYNAGLLYGTDLTGNGGNEKIFSGEAHFRQIAIAGRGYNELVLAGDRLLPDDNRRDSWLLFTDQSAIR